MSRVLFVDFDGVLHATHGPAEAIREFVWLPVLIELIAPHKDVRIVVHASARRTSTADFIGTRLGLGRVGPGSLYAGVTSPSLERWPSIQAWVAQRPEVTSYCVLDDQASEFPSPPPAELILCNPIDGITELRVQVALKRFLTQR